jgi:hypothetical protein
MRKLWIRFILWLHHVCPKHGPMEGGSKYVYCKSCYAASRQEQQTYLDGLCKELNS